MTFLDGKIRKGIPVPREQHEQMPCELPWYVQGMTCRGVSLWGVGEMCPIPLPVMGLGMSMGWDAVPANEMPGKVLVGVEGWRGSSGKVCLALKKEHKEGIPWRSSG